MAQVETVAAEVSGVAERLRNALEAVLLVQALRCVHAGQCFEVTAAVGQAPRLLQAQRDQLETRRKEKLVAKTSRSADAEALAQPLALTLFSQQFSALIDGR